MGTCMSKDKKGATVAVHTTHVSTSSSSSLSAQHKYLAQEGEPAISPVKSTEKRPENLPSIHFSEEENARDSVSTDKHVVEIRLPITSPNRFTASPTSATLAARAIAAIARPSEEKYIEAASEDSLDVEEECDEEVANPASNARNSSLPLFYSSYLSGASFSRDLAAFSRDIASLSCSPLKKSPSVNGAHDLIAAAIKAAHMSPQDSGHNKRRYAGMVNEDYSTNRRSRSLPKRFYGKANQNAYHAAARPTLLHKRSSSRDAVCINSMALSPLIGAARREEASGEVRVCARQAAARRSVAPSFPQAVTAAAAPVSFRAKERSPINRRSRSTGKIAADATICTTTNNALHLQENRHSSLQLENAPDKLRGREALKDMTNCSTWVDLNSHELKDSFKDLKKAIAETKVNIQDSRDNYGDVNGNDNLLHEGLHRETAHLECLHSPLCCTGKPCSLDNDRSDTFSMYPASMHRVESWIKALAEMNIENSLFSEVEDSEMEVEGELDLIQFAFDARLSPRKELQAQQARNLLLKEAAMDAFARPSFDSKNLQAVGLQDGKQPSPGLAALMSMRLPDAETRTTKIREVLKLLSSAESEMGSEEKTLFYDQLQMVLDSVKTQTSCNEHSSQGRARRPDNMTVKSVTSRANSWPRVMKEPAHIITSVENNSSEAINNTANHDTNMKIIKSLTSHNLLPETVPEQEIEDQIPSEQCLAESCVRLNGAQALESCECEVMEDTLEILENDNNTSLLSREGSGADNRLESKVCPVIEEDGHLIQQADKFPTVACSRQEFVKEAQWGVDIAEESTIEVQNGEGFHHKPAQASMEAACTSFDHTKAEDFTGAAEGPLMEVKELSPCSEVPYEKMGCTAARSEGKEMLDLPQPRWDMRGVNLEDNIHGDSGQSSLLHNGDAIGVCRGGSLSRDGAGGCCRSDDVGSDASFEFRVRSTASTPLSTPSTPMLSTASTPRHASHADPPLTAQALVEIWEAFDNNATM